jgi:hypothetical protein
LNEVAVLVPTQTVSQRTQKLQLWPIRPSSAFVDDMDSFDDLGASLFVSVVVKVASPDQQQPEDKER